MIQSQKVSLNHLAEFREDVEGIVAAHAAQRGNRDQIQELNRLLDQARACVEQGEAQRSAFIEIDKRIHMALADITGNPIYISVLHSIHENIHRYYDRFLSMDRRELQENYQDLCDLVQAVANANSDQARTIAQNHVRRFSQYMQERAQEKDNSGI